MVFIQGIRFLLCIGLLVGCSAQPPKIKTLPPKNTHDICALIKRKPQWYRLAQAAAQRWGTSPHILLAIIQGESGFKHNARPLRAAKGRKQKKYLSSAYGFAQALDATWSQYCKHTGKRGARRDNFEDCVHFIGWYNNRSTRQCGIRKNDSYNLYLAYHEGHVGFNKRTHKKKKAILHYARGVAAQANAYKKQLKRCQVSPIKKGARKSKFIDKRGLSLRIR
ncbi:transglycosylase SLT domain-containing protein [Candidatus Sororendozoicomonas aggregata]|uniref:transglycosylase SLT domain-containing protein n=1 Tax=Candidatus Sororendozoicomonas aggregata TaxID=3073239 RepID=UPI002ED3C76D